MKKLLSHYSSLCAFLFFALALIAPSGYSYGPILLLLIALPFLFSKGIYQDLNRSSLYLLSTLLLFGVIWALDIFLRYPGGNFGKPIRYILSTVAILFLLRFPPSSKSIWLGIAFGAIGTGFFAIFLKLTTNATRVSGFSHNAIQYGNISLLLGFLSFVGLWWAFQKQNNKHLWVLLLGTGFIMGLVASLLSGSRGGWVSAPIMFAFILFYTRHTLTKKTISLIVISFTFIVSAAFLTPETGVEKRVSQVFTEINLYQEGHTKTSIGTRFEFWRAAIIAAKEKPVLGWGKPGYLEKLQELVNTDIASPGIISDPHNMYLSVLVFRGAVGLISLLLLYLVPLYLFRKSLNTHQPETLALSIAGITVVIAYMDFSLTQTTLKFNSGTTFFCFSVVFIYTALLNTQKKKDNLPTHTTKTVPVESK